MNSHELPRLLVIVLTLVLVAAGLATAPVGAADGSQWSDSITHEDIVVQDCRGPSNVQGFSPTLAFGFDFAIVSDYRVDRSFQVIADYTGIGHQVMEVRHVSFAGIAANSKTGLSLSYDGTFTRIGTYDQGDVTIADLALHLIPSNEEDVTITVERDSSGLIDSPEAVLLAYAARGLHTSLCNYFAGLKVAG
jgi:hypothetical protein